MLDTDTAWTYLPQSTPMTGRHSRSSARRAVLIAVGLAALLAGCSYSPTKPDPTAARPNASARSTAPATDSDWPYTAPSRRASHAISRVPTRLRPVATPDRALSWW